ncbi:sigma-54-dependent Fis family transcriptional regulator [Candidatus Termititenax persephonae]|uniref:DNA-binding transcriptional regulator NtrC n=1 Tax=Candidatus Termititenax persephonae TaxID=2218525 RepID=A0A388TFQ2_9BACT|nr:sigma-54-dependent Fis family transcriptional regulator [Candidatus Termititenax persephonae]
MTKILLVDDSQNELILMERILKKHIANLETLTASGGKEALKLIKKENPQVVLMDIEMPVLSGLDTLVEIKKISSKLLVIIITGKDSQEYTIDAMKKGAYDCVTKNHWETELLPAIHKALRASEMMNDVVTLQNTMDLQDVNLNVRTIIGLSPKMREVYKKIGMMEGKSVPVLLLGESGTGKEIVARNIYHESERKDKTFLAINCAAIPEALLEAELFGYEKGAFTGAVERKIGKFELCNGGTIFLDEIGDMPMSLQAKILRVLQEHALDRVGGMETIKVDVRVISATNKNLQELIAENKFREDLYYRLNIVEIHLPPLREKTEDIPDLVAYFIKRFNYEFGRNISEIPKKVMEQLKKYAWPGNVRELENTIKRAVVTTIKGHILQLDIKSLGTNDQEPVPASEPSILDKAFDPATPLDALIDAVADSLLERMLIMPESDPERRDLIGKLEKTLITKALCKLDNNQVRTAKLLGITRNTLRSRIEKL